MPRTCLACAHADRAEIDRALVAGESYRSVSKRVAISDTSLFRHRAHIETALTEAKALVQERHVDELAARLAELSTRARRLADAAEVGGDLKTALAGVRELARILEIAARVEGRIRSLQVNIGLTNFKLEGLSNDDTARLIKEKFDAPEVRALVQKILQCSPWFSEQEPPAPPEWVYKWAYHYASWKFRNQKQVEVG
jgi:hypothetical protein